MRPRRAAASKIVALIIYIIVILVATPQAQQPVSFSGSPGAITAGPAAVAPDATGIDLLVGRSTILNVGSSISRVSLTVPDVADAMVTSPQQLLIHGKAPGVISMFVWDRAGGIKTYEVNVRRDLTQLIEQMRNLFPGEAVSVVGSGKDVVLSGTVSSKYVIDKAGEVAGGYVEKKENVVNLLKQQEGVASNQVMLRVRFAEVSRSALQELGASFFTGPGGFHDYVASASTQQFPSINYTALDRTSIQGVDKWGGGRDTVTAVGGQGTFSDFLNLFLFNNRYNVGTLIKAMQDKGVFQSLAEPNLIALNGKEASFLAGGEYPYPVVQSGAGNNSISITFKEFGIRLNFTPTVLGGDLINLKVRPEVSSLDFSNAIVLDGFRIPALSTRRTETEVELQDGQTFAIAGLLNNTVQSTMRKIPGIGDIPILGWLFKSQALQKNQTELVVMITPQIVRRGSTGVSAGLPSAVEPYLGRPNKSLQQPAPYTGSPRYPANGASPAPSQPNRDNNNNAAASSLEPAQANQPAADQNAVTEQKPAADQKATPAQQAPKALSKAEQQQRENDRRHAEAAAKSKAEQDRKDAEAKKAADLKAAEERDRQQKLDQERAKREAEVARKNAEVERQKQAEAKKREKSLAEAAERLRQAQAAYQAEIDKAKGGKGGEPKN
jgi:pilus assembly protein CpaC